MKKLLLTLLIVTLLIGCKHDDIDKEWTRINIDNYSYYIYQTQYATIDKDNVGLFVILPGYGGGYEFDGGNVLKSYFKKTGKQGIIILPYIYYKDPSISQWSLSMAKEVINTTKHSKLYLMGFSAGACTILSLSNQLDVDKMVPVAAGAYKDIGGKPEDELDVPSIKDVWFVNGYKVSTYNKYGILFDGTVYIDPVKRLVDRYGYKMTLAENVDHSGTIKLLTKDTKILDWFTEDLYQLETFD